MTCSKCNKETNGLWPVDLCQSCAWAACSSFDTPRADAAAFDMTENVAGNIERYQVVPLAVARELERELAEAQAESDRYQLALEGIAGVPSSMLGS